MYKAIGAKEDLFIIDIRKKEDYIQNFIEGSMHCEWADVGQLIEDGELKKDDKIIIVCYTGQTAGQVTSILKLLGYNACSLMGGMVNGWMKESMPIEATCST